MKVILRTQQKNILRLDQEEELIGSLKRFCQRENIKAGFFQGFGAANRGEVAFYNLNKKKYITQKFDRPVEILNIIGNISILNNEIIIHAHGIFGDQKLKVFGGHINFLVISPTCEMLFIKFKGKIARKYSKKIGLNLMDLFKNLP